MQRKNRGEGTSLPMGELVKDPAALARLAQSGEARQLVSLLKQSGGVQEAARAAADGDPGQLMQMMDRPLNAGGQSWWSASAGRQKSPDCPDMSRSGPERGSVCGGI